MKIQVLPSRGAPPASQGRAYLITDNWNDWGEFCTQYYLIVFDELGEKFDVGSVKIGQFGLEGSMARPNLPNTFGQLDEQIFFSLGADEEYYNNLNKIGFNIRGTILKQLNDIAANLDLYYKAKDEKVMHRSLLRDITVSTLSGQFRRLSHGGLKQTTYDFAYEFGGRSKTEIDFHVHPNSKPPTNVHVLIGSNGVGKTFLLNSMVKSLTSNVGVSPFGKFVQKNKKGEQDIFANLVLVSFSAFEEPVSDLDNSIKKSEIPYSYIGLEDFRRSEDIKAKADNRFIPAAQFAASLRRLKSSPKLERWKDALNILEYDPIFNRSEILELSSLKGNLFNDTATTLYNQLSSGHKSILLSITKLVEHIEERSLVLIDEPEAHLHPPLLAAFIRALSDLLINRNALAIIATHSPVIVQEVPKSCVWKIRRNENKIIAERPENETFGENVSVLTRDIFELEVTNSGFHKLLRQAVQDSDSYEEALEIFEGELGSEAKAILRTLMIQKSKD